MNAPLMTSHCVAQIASRIEDFRPADLRPGGWIFVEDGCPLGHVVLEPYRRVMSGFGMAPLKREGHTTNLETGESHRTTAAERAAAARDTRTWMELPVDPIKQTREQIHRAVDKWLDAWHREHKTL
jgi:hypothetical protein